MRRLPDLAEETAAIAAGHSPVAGIDEAGRGPLAGPVVAAAVVLGAGGIPPGMDDSKRLAPGARQRIAEALRRSAGIGVGIGVTSVEEIDALNILRAAHLAMCRAVAALPVAPALALVDGNLLPPDLPCRGRALVGGDGRCLSIAAASIIAKVTRDRIMVDLAQQHPGYGWERNMGYPTAEHRMALRRLGPTPHHRRSFAPVYNML